MQLYVNRNNQQLGPFTEAEVKAKLASGELSLLDHVWWPGQATWMPLGQSPYGGVVPPAFPIPGAPGHLPPPHQGYEKTSDFALWSLICGVASPFVCGLPILPAIILGHLGLAETKKNPAIKGRGMAWAGLIIGYVLVALIALSMVLGLLFSVLGSSWKSTFNTIEIKSVQTPTAQDNDDSSGTNSDTATNSPASSPDSSTNATPVVTP